MERGFTDEAELASSPTPELARARELFPATRNVSYLNTAATGLASNALAETYHRYIDEWTANGLDFTSAEEAADRARTSVAAVMGADPADIALIASVSEAAGLVAAQFGAATRGQNVVIGDREYSSNYYPWRLLANKGYDIRLVPFRNGGVEPDGFETLVDGGTVLVAFSGVQSATGHRSDIRAISGIARAAGAIVFVDGAQLVGALPVAHDLPHVDVLATPDHKFLLNAGRGLGYCYISRTMQDRFVPKNAGWRAARAPLKSFFGPDMDLSPTASRFDNSISWLAAIGNEVAVSVFDRFGADAIFSRNRELATLLRESLSGAGISPVDLPEARQSTLVSVSGRHDHDPVQLVRDLEEHGIVVAARDGNLRLSVHFYNDETDIDRVTNALASS